MKWLIMLFCVSALLMVSADEAEVNQAVASVQGLGVFQDDYGFLKRIACVESNYGEDPNTYRGGYYGGIWQVDKVGFQDTQLFNSHPSLQNKYPAILQQLGIQWKTVSWEKCVDPLYSALAARLLLSVKPGSIPADLAGQAQYWKDEYNSAEGAGTVQDFIDRVNQCEQAAASTVSAGDDIDSSGSAGSSKHLGVVVGVMVGAVVLVAAVVGLVVVRRRKHQAEQDGDLNNKLLAYVQME